MLLKERIARELERIALANDGVLRQEDVVAFARDPSTALHSQFDWDDTEAAHQWRLQKAAQVIRMQVRVLEEDAASVRAYVSLTPDRANGGGYRMMASVLSNEELSRQMMLDALAELSAVRRKYRTLQRLSGVWNEIDAAVAAESEATAA